MSTTTLTNNAALVATMYEAFGRGDIATILANVDDSCNWIGGGGEYTAQGGTYRGSEVGNFFQKLGESTEFTEFTPKAIHNINDNEVVAFGYMNGISRKTGKPAGSDWTMHFKFNDEGKVIYFQDFFNTAAVYVSNLA